jgi:UDP-3-O-[3-hydroxymyristoyl] glucosamine N-acyltransferase
MDASISLGELAKRFGLSLHGSAATRIQGVCTLQHGGPGVIAFLASRAYTRYLADTAAAAVILEPGKVDACPVPALVTDEPYLAFARIASLFKPSLRASPGVHPTAWVSREAVVDATASIGPQCVVETGAHIAEGTVLGPGCLVGKHCRIGPGSHLVAGVILCTGVAIGQRVVIAPGAVLGARGFGFARDRERWVSVPQLGSLRVGDDVEIGANTTIDRGALEDTVIEEGVKLDNQIQIGHNVRIGAHTAIAGCTGIAGSTRIGRRCMIGGNVGINGHIDIADDIVIAGMAMVTKSLTAAGAYASGVPAAPVAQWRRQIARIRQLEKMTRRIKDLAQRFDNKGDIA